MNRRTLLDSCGALAWAGQSGAAAPPSGINLLTAPVEVGDAWNGAANTDTAAAISRRREACLSGVRL
jgi:hypothetical protein